MRQEAARLAACAADPPAPTHDLVWVYVDAGGDRDLATVRLYPIAQARQIAAAAAACRWVGRTRSDTAWRPVEPDALPAWAVEVGLWVGAALDPGGITGMAQRVAAVDRRRRERWAESDADARARRTEESHRAPVRSPGIRR